jgi:hypothetical protein
MSELKKKWGLSVEPTTLTLQQRKDAMLLLAFLNIYGSYNNALDMYKEYWLNVVYALPSTKETNYKSITQLRYVALKRIKQAFDAHIMLN